MADEATSQRQLQLVVVTYERKALETTCDAVELPGRLGNFGVLPGHMPIVSTLKVGELSYRRGKIEHFLVVSGGFCEVVDDVVTVMAEFAQTPEEIDRQAAEREAEEAEALLGSSTGDELKAALARVEAATVRIKVAGRVGL